jgi:Leucine-rich repeat (LRR) protein
MRRVVLALAVLTVAGCQNERVHHIEALRKLGGGVFPANAGSDQPVLSVRLLNKPITDEDLKHVEGFTELQTLEIHGTPITDQGLASVKGLTNLTLLDLSKARISDAGLANLQDLKKLEKLRLEHDAVSDAGLHYLKGLTSLKLLGLEGTDVTPEGVRELRRSLPGLKVSPASLGGG